MSNERWELIKELFYTTLEQPVDQRRHFLHSLRSEETSIRQEVEKLLDSYESEFLETPIILEGIRKKFPLPFQLTIGQKFANFEILETLGRGGMGEVYLVRDLSLKRLAALKLLHRDSDELSEHSKRLLREARTAAQLDHPNICAIYEVGEFSGLPYVVMQYVKGRTIEDEIGSGSISPERALEIIEQAARALVEAHNIGIVHRDIKPSNIVIDDRGQIRLLDFGLAKNVLIETGDLSLSAVTEIGTIAGTVRYMSPEQVRGTGLDAQSDIWSLGVVLYEMLTGHLPFFGETKTDIIAAILRSEPPSLEFYFLSYPKELDKTLARLLQRQKNLRYQKMADVAQDLHRVRIDQRASIWLRKEQVPLVSTNNGAKFPFTETARLLSTNPSSRSTQERGSIFLSGMERLRNGLFSNSGLITVWATALLFLLVSIGLSYYTDMQRAAIVDQLNVKLTVAPLFRPDRRPEGAFFDPSFSPDGKFLAYSVANDGYNSIYVKNVDQGEPIRLSDGVVQDWSTIWDPDGFRVAFLSVRGGKSGIWTMSYLGGDPVFLSPLEENLINVRLIKWGIDSNEIFIEKEGGLATVDIGESKVTDLGIPSVDGAKQLQISPDEKKIVFALMSDGVDEIWIQDLDGKRSPERISNEGGNSNFPVWFPDSESIAFASDQKGIYQIFIYNLPTGTLFQITDNPFRSRVPMASTDGARVFYLASDNFDND
ncbi:MAG: protein kinase [Pyrinomonadaceae bacterium]